MKEMIQKRLSSKALNGKKGFTLIEVIVVLVILAILAAIAIPALTGYIDKANERALISEARNVQVALQEMGTESYSNGAVPVTSGSGAAGSAVINTVFPKYDPLNLDPTTKTVYEAVNELTGANIGANDIKDIKFSNTTLSDFKYQKGGTGKTVTYSSTNGYSVS